MKHITFTFLYSLMLFFSDVLNAGIPDWTINPSNFQYSMSGTLRVKMDSVYFNASDTRIAVFVGSELRGVVNGAVMISGNAYFPITIYSNMSSGEIMHFKVYLAARDTINEADELPVFNRNLTLGNVSAPFILTIHPNCTSPLITSCVRDTILNTDKGVCGATYSYAALFSGSPAPGFTYTFSGATIGSGTGTGSGSFFNKGLITVKLVADNACKPKDSCSFTITVNDNEMPTISCDSQINQNNDAGLCSAVVNYMAPTGSDNCLPTTTTQTEGMPSGSAFPIGMTTNIFQVTDDLGNSSTCSLVISINDTELPKITCGSDIIIENETGLCSAEVNFETPIGTDNCDGANTILLTALGSGSSFPVGETVTIFKVTDAAGYSATCSFTVSVNDDEEPEINCCVDLIRNTDIGACSYKTINSEFNVASCSDNCGIASKSYKLSGATSGNGTTTLSGVVLKKGITTIEWTILDAAGNSSSCSSIVTVNDKQAPLIACPQNINVYAAKAQNSVPAASVVLGTPSVSDNCGILYPITNNSPVSYPLGITNVSWMVTDSSSNTSTCNQQVNAIVFSGYCAYPLVVRHIDTTKDQAIVKWKDVRSGAGYSVRLRRQLTPGVYTPYSNWMAASGPGTSHQFTGLMPKSFYNCQVRTECGLAYSIFINDWFHTLPGTRTLTDPGNNIGAAKTNHPKEFASIELLAKKSKDEITVKISGFDQRMKEVTMSDPNGNIVFKVEMEAKLQEMDLDLKTLGVHSGIYEIRVSDGINQTTEQLMIEN